MLRFSSYTILSNPMYGGGYVLMSGLSGSMDVIDDSLGRLLEDTLPVEPRRADALLSEIDSETIAHWKEHGYVTDLTDEQERALVVGIAGAMHDNMVQRPTYMIVPNLDCNYRCTYCFERPLQNGLNVLNSSISHHRGNVVMDKATVHEAYEAIACLQSRAKQKPGGQIILYGGEPLDVKNEEVVREIVSTGIERNFRFAVITNGHHLDTYLDLLGTGKIEQVQISIDGPKRVHDTRRIHVGRESSYDVLSKNIELALRSCDAEIQIRVHVDPSNISLFEELLQAFIANGWVDHPHVVIYANTVYSKDKSGVVVTGFEVADIDAQLAALVRPFRNVFTSAPDIHATRAMQGAFAAGDRFSLKGTYCTANSGNYIFAPDGAIYACWESVGKDCSRIGTYTGANGLSIDAQAADRWFGRSIETLSACQRCQYALICGGGCAQYAEYKTGTLYSPYCDDFQRTFRSTLAHACDKHIADMLTPGQDAEVMSTANVL